MAKTNQPTFTVDDEKAAKEVAKAQATADGTLGDPGYQTDEDLAKKAERLISAAHKLLEKIDVATADPANLEIEREVRSALDDMNEVYVSNAQSEYAYAWIYRDPHNEHGGRYVRKMQALGFEVVSGPMPEALEHKTADGTRVVSDCLLMRVRVDRLAVLEKRDRLLREAQQAGIVARVYDLAARAGTRVYDKLPGFVEDSLASTADQRRAVIRQRAMRDFHRLNQGGKIDQMLKTGAIPGIPAPGAGNR